MTVTNAAESNTPTTFTANIAATSAIDGGSNGNLIATQYSIGVDRTLPTVTSINRKAGQTASTNVSPVEFTVTFSESVTGISTSDFVASTTGTLTGNVTVSNVSAASGTTVDVQVAVTSGEGTLGLNFVAAAAGGVLDAASNVSTANKTGDQTVIVDKTPPVIAITSISVDDYVNAVEDGSPVPVVGTIDNINDVTQDVIITVGGVQYGSGATSYTGTTWTVNIPAAAFGVSINEGSGITVLANITDAAGNAATQANRNFTYDATPPVVSAAISNVTQLENAPNLVIDLSGVFTGATSYSTSNPTTPFTATVVGSNLTIDYLNPGTG
jgi:hypothetical protein